jgi:AraC-like DNA-binding protein
MARAAKLLTPAAIAGAPARTHLGVVRGKTATISALTLAFNASALAALGFDVDRLLGLAGLSKERLEGAHARLPVDAVQRFWDAAVRVSGDPAIGLRVGAHVHEGALGGFDYLLRHSGTLRQVVERASRYVRLVDDLGRIDLVERGGVAAVRFSRAGGKPQAHAEIACLFSALLSVCHAEWPCAHFDGVSFAAACPTSRAAYVKHFGCPVSFGEPHNEVRFAASLLDVPARRADAKLGLVLEEHAKRLLDELPEEDPFLLAARTELREQLSRGSPAVGALARALHMSERTLRRRLRTQGTSYHALLEELRGELARHWVSHTNDGFAEIADRLAFADASAFFRAFRRWTGTTPARYRTQAAAASLAV